MTTGNTNGSDDQDALVQRLLQVAGAREDPPREDYEQVLAAATAALQARLARRRRVRVVGGAGLAAAALLGLAALWTFLPVGPAPAVEVVRVMGDVQWRAAGTRSWSALRLPARSLAPGDALRTTGNARVALSLGALSTLRLDEHTEIALAAGKRIELHRGAAYVDSGVGDTVPAGVEIVTAFGTAREVGTQFEVRLVPDGLRVRVREGLVMLRYADESTNVAGEELMLWSSGRLERSALRRDDPGWGWTETVAVAPVIDNQPLETVLEWVRRETGRVIRYSSAEVERRAKAVVLHGSIRDLAPLEALDAVLATTDLSYAIMDDGSILIRPR
jgi:ferric-dicitrate binding protein FerR (iron transport regulator)